MAARILRTTISLTLISFFQLICTSPARAQNHNPEPSPPPELEQRKAFAAPTSDGRLFASRRSTLTQEGSGSPIKLDAARRNQVETPPHVKVGEPVTAIFQSSNFVIKARLISLEMAKIGERIKAKNPDTGIIVHGVVTAPGEIVVMEK